MENTYGDFGKNANLYSQARRGYPPEVFSLLFGPEGLNPQGRNALVLDLGCGTGIASRQIAGRNRFVVGLDKDRNMIDSALLAQNENTAFVLGKAEALPFFDELFDGVTAFGALHWFNTSLALSEASRVLRSGGIALIVNKHDIGDLKTEFRQILADIIQMPLPNPKSNYAPVELLRSSKFSIIRDESYSLTETFSGSEALAYFQTTGAWSLIKPDLLRVAMTRTKDFIERHLIGGYLHRPIRVQATLARKD